MKKFFRELLKDALSTSIVMFKMMIPVTIAVKILKELGAIELIGQTLSPLMKFVGLPGEMGLVWATGMITNLFGGILAFISLSTSHPLTVAQVTVLAVMMLVAHTFAIELQIAKKTGVKLITMFIIRFGFAFIMGVILNLIYSSFGAFQEVAKLTWKPTQILNPTILQWAIGELKNYGVIFSFIFSLLFLVKLLKQIGIIDLMTRLMGPVLELLGISKEATTITIVGLTLGVVYGGALIINESKSEKINRKDILYSMILMGLCHSVIEDSILMISIGGNFTGIVIFRIIISLLIVFGIVRITKGLSDKAMLKYFLTKKKDKVNLP